MKRKAKWQSTAFGIAGLLAFGIGGVYMRTRMELGKAPTPLNLAAINDSRLVASLTDSQEPDDGEFFLQVQNMIEQQYVDAVDDESKLAIGAVKGMIQSLADTQAQYMTKEQFSAYNESLKGSFEGIGAECRYKFNEEQLKKYKKAREIWIKAKEKGETPPPMDYDPDALIPDVEVIAIIPGSPAETVGLKPGDLIDGADGKWVVSNRSLDELEALAKQIVGTKIDPAKEKELGLKYRERTKSSMTPARVMDKVMLGKSGTVKLRWLEGGDAKKVREANVEKKLTSLPAASLTKEGAIHLSFADGADSKLKELMEGKTDFKIDLRDLPGGSLTSVQKCLGVLLPTGDYGFILNKRSGRKEPFKVEGSGSANKVDVFVNPGISNEALLFVQVLQKAGKTKIIGTLPPKQPSILLVESLEDGSGYVLPTAVYSPEAPK